MTYEVDRICIFCTIATVCFNQNLQLIFFFKIWLSFLSLRALGMIVIRKSLISHIVIDCFYCGADVVAIKVLVYINA